MHKKLATVGVSGVGKDQIGIGKDQMKTEGRQFSPEHSYTV